MKDPIALKRADTDKVVAWCCGECGMYCGDQEEYARYHCGGRPCDICGKPSDRQRMKCSACIAQEIAEKDAARKEKALHISPANYDGPVYWEERDRFYADLDLAWDDVCDHFYENPELAQEQTLWACDELQLTLCADDIIRDALESQEHYEEAWEHVSDKAAEELRLFCAAWNDAHGSQVVSWFPNNQIIEIPKEWQEEYIKELEEEKT